MTDGPMTIEFHGHGFGDVGPGTVTVIKNNTPAEQLPPRNDLRDHSPDGFQIGYSGSGPAQLALALLAYVYDDDKPFETTDDGQLLYQVFKSEQIAQLSGPEWYMTEEFIREWESLQ